MFERYTEKARRTVFFARYEASQFGSEFITTEHLLLGILRDDKELVRQVLPKVDFESVRLRVEKHAESSKIKYPVSVDLPLADDAKRALTYGMEEADRLKSRHIGTEHLLLGLIRDKEFPSAKLLDEFGASLESLRKRVDALPVRPNLPATQSFAQRVLESSREYRRTDLTPSTVEIHGRKWNVEGVRSLVARLKSHPWYWERKQWHARDVVYEKNARGHAELRSSERLETRESTVVDPLIGWGMERFKVFFGRRRDRFGEKSIFRILSANCREVRSRRTGYRLGIPGHRR
jgi:hypothetical protein